MSKHTPGPWQHSVRLSASENHRGFSIWTADGWALADVQPADENGIEGEANARLIAAAPLLYEALQDLCDTLGECGMTEKARAAIAELSR